MGVALGAGCWRYLPDHCVNLNGDTTCRAKGGMFCSSCTVDNDGCVDVEPGPGCYHEGGGLGSSGDGAKTSTSWMSSTTDASTPTTLSSSTFAETTVMDMTMDTSATETSTSSTTEGPVTTTGSTETSGSTSEMTGATGCETGGHPHEGCYEGMWSGDCPGFVSGNISFVVSSSGSLEGELAGDLQGSISGSVNNGGSIGNGVLAWDFASGCEFDGQINMGNGTWSCPRMKPCSGTWMASIL